MVGLVCYKAKILGTRHFVADLSSRRETGLPTAGAKTNALIPMHEHTRGFVLVYILVTAGH